MANSERMDALERLLASRLKTLANLAAKTPAPNKRVGELSTTDARLIVGELLKTIGQSEKFTLVDVETHLDALAD